MCIAYRYISAMYTDYRLVRWHFKNYSHLLIIKRTFTFKKNTSVTNVQKFFLYFLELDYRDTLQVRVKSERLHKCVYCHHASKCKADLLSNGQNFRRPLSNICTLVLTNQISNHLKILIIWRHTKKAGSNIIFYTTWKNQSQSLIFSYMRVHV